MNMLCYVMLANAHCTVLYCISYITHCMNLHAIDSYALQPFAISYSQKLM